LSLTKKIQTEKNVSGMHDYFVQYCKFSIVIALRRYAGHAPHLFRVRFLHGIRL
jgi:uncharacterized protein YutD